MATDLERLVVSLEANITKYEREFRRAREQTNTNARAIEKRTEEMGNRIDKIMSTSSAAISTGLGRLGGLIGASLSVTALKGYADAWTEAGNKIAAAGEQGSVAAKRQSELADIAIRSRSDFGATVELYTGLYRATEELGKSQADVARVTETIAKAFTVGGQSAATAAGAITQLNQAFAAGKLSGDELNSVLEGAPPLARLIATEFGVSVGKLKKLAEDGKLTSEKVFGAIEKGTVEIERQFAVTIPTITQSFNNLGTAMTRYVGQTDQAAGGSQKIAQAIQGIATNIDIVAPLAATLGAALLGLAVGGPVGAGLAGLTTGFYLLGDSITPIQGELATLSDYAVAAFQMASTASAEAGAYIQAQFAKAADLITSILSSIGTDSSTAFDTLVSAVKQSLNITIGTYVFAVKTIKATWDNLGFSLADTIVTAMNAVIATVEAALKSVTGAINGILGAINSVSSAAGGATIDLFKGVDLPRIKNGYAGAGAAAGKAYGEAFESLTKDYVGATIEGGKGILKDLRDTANANAAKRAEAKKASDAQRAADEKTAAELRASKKAKGGADDDDKKKKGGGDGAEKVNDYEREIKAIEKRTRAFDSERESLAKSATETAKAEASFRLLEAAKKANVPVTDELRAKVDTLATAYANAKVALDEAKEKQQQFEAGSRQAGAMLSDAFKDAILNGEKLTVVLDRLLKSLASKGFDSFFDTLFSKDGAGTNLFKSILSGSGFASGGYTGPGRKNAPRGVVHAGEVVWSQADVRRAGGVGTVEAMRRGSRGYAAGGPVGMSGVAPMSAGRAISAGARSSARTSIDARTTINAPNADRAGLARLERIVMQQEASLPKRVYDLQRRGG